MRLTEFTDYSLRVLLFCASNPGRSITIAELADTYAISRNHLMKVVNDLSREGLIQTTRGRGGGLQLLKPAAEICIGDVVRHAEPDFRMVECFDPVGNTCTLSPQCKLSTVIDKALKSFMAELDRVTLADLVRRPQVLPGGAARVIPVARLVSSPERTRKKAQPLATGAAKPAKRKKA
jgi:Rrf2 family nitric oxide-sensitive transcriptional repressor